MGSGTNGADSYSDGGRVADPAQHGRMWWLWATESLIGLLAIALAGLRQPVLAGSEGSILSVAVLLLASTGTVCISRLATVDYRFHGGGAASLDSDEMVVLAGAVLLPTSLGLVLAAVTATAVLVAFRGRVVSFVHNLVSYALKIVIGGTAAAAVAGRQNTIVHGSPTRIVLGLVAAGGAIWVVEAGTSLAMAWAQTQRVQLGYVGQSLRRTPRVVVGGASAAVLYALNPIYAPLAAAVAAKVVSEQRTRHLWLRGQLDAKTGLVNATSFARSLHAEVERASRRGAGGNPPKREARLRVLSTLSNGNRPESERRCIHAPG